MLRQLLPWRSLGLAGTDLTAGCCWKRPLHHLGGLTTALPDHDAVAPKHPTFPPNLIRANPCQLVPQISRWKSSTGKHDGSGNHKSTPSFAELVSAARSNRAKDLSSIKYPEVVPSSERFYDRERRGSRNEDEEWNESRGPRTREPRSPRMKDCKTLEAAINLLYGHLEETGKLSPPDTAAFWSALPRLLDNQKRQRNDENEAARLGKIIQRTAERINTFKSRHLTQTALGMAKMAAKIRQSERNIGGNSSINTALHSFLCHRRNNNEGIFNRIAQASIQHLPNSKPQDLSNLAYAYFVIGYVPDLVDGQNLFDQIATNSIEKSKDFNGQDISNMVYAYAKCEESSDKLFAALGDVVASHDSLDKFAPQALANTVWSFAKMKIFHRGLFQKVGDDLSLLDDLHSFNPQSLSNVVWSFATVGAEHVGLFQKVGNQIVSFDDLSKFKPQNISNILLAFAKVGASHQGLFRRLGDEIVSANKLIYFNPQNFANTVWAFASMGYPHPDLFQKVGDEIFSFNNLKHFKPQELSITVWAFSKTSAKHPALFQKIGDEIVSRDNLDEFTAQNFSNVVLAYATADFSHQALFEKVANAIVRLNDLRFLNSQEISNIAWAFAKSKQYHPELFVLLANAAVEKNKELSPQSISNLLWAFSTMDFTRNLLFSELSPIVRDVLNQCDDQALTNIAWAYAVSNVEAPNVFNSNFVDVCVSVEDEFMDEGLRQLYQWHLWRKELQSNITLPPSLQKRCYETFISGKHVVSKLQKEVVKEMKTIGLDPREEVLLDSGYRIDALVEVEGKDIAVEINGPNHFIGRKRIGSVMLKQRQISKIDGIPVVSIPYWEWDGFGKSREKKQEYLRMKLLHNGDSSA